MGELTFMKWNLNIPAGQIWVRGQISGLNECNLRIVNKFEFGLFVDLDEFILPYGNTSDLIQMIEGMGDSSNVGAFLFKNAFHFIEWFNDTSSTEKFAHQLFGNFDVKKTNNIMTKVRPYLQTQTKTRRMVELNDYGIRSKFIVRPEAADIISIHFVQTFFKGFIRSSHWKHRT